jgi:hypothetical protein
VQSSVLQGDQKVSVHLMISIQEVTSNVQSVCTIFIILTKQESGESLHDLSYLSNQIFFRPYSREYVERKI